MSFHRTTPSLLSEVREHDRQVTLFFVATAAVSASATLVAALLVTLSVL